MMVHKQIQNEFNSIFGFKDTLYLLDFYRNKIFKGTVKKIFKVFQNNLNAWVAQIKVYLLFVNRTIEVYKINKYIQKFSPF